MNLTEGKKAKFFMNEDVAPVQDGSQIVLIPGDFGSPEEWASNIPSKRRFEFQINVEGNSFADVIDISDRIENLLMDKGILRIGDAFSDRIDYLYVAARRYRFFNRGE